MNRAATSLLTLVAAAALAMACSPSAEGEAKATPKAPAETSAQAQPPASTAAQAQAAQPGGFSGTVVETMDASSYTYVLVDTGTEKSWAATNKFKVAVGDRVMVPGGTEMMNFHSSALDRTFPKIVFASAIYPAGPAGETAAPSHPATEAMPHIGAPKVEQEADVKVDPAPGGLTVAAVHAEAATLGGKTVTVRGRVVKANPGIMGTNWYHIQDGTGTASDGSHDLTVTSNDAAAVGDVITATGTVATDKDFGFGYKYSVIVEKASLKK